MAANTDLGYPNKSIFVEVSNYQQAILKTIDNKQERHYYSNYITVNKLISNNRKETSLNPKWKKKYNNCEVIVINKH